jgi:hypothetical protein
MYGRRRRDERGTFRACLGIQPPNLFIIVMSEPLVPRGTFGEQISKLFKPLKDEYQPSANLLHRCPIPYPPHTVAIDFLSRRGPGPNITALLSCRVGGWARMWLQFGLVAPGAGPQFRRASVLSRRGLDPDLVAISACTVLVMELFQITESTRRAKIPKSHARKQNFAPANCSSCRGFRPGVSA